ncbi:MAG TPA: ABC transporter permease subunit [Chloroflexota bacterium]|nr:ABC transporter permease subunit [Chloroflexota bacterium]
MSASSTREPGVVVTEFPSARTRSVPPTTLQKTWRRIWFHRYIYVLMLPGLLWMFIFQYVPMWGIVIAFENYQPWQGVLHSPWVGLANFEAFFTSADFPRLVRNTLWIGLLNIVFVFPAPIILALLLNEVRHSAYKRVIQTVSYLPNFVSWVVVGGLLIYTFSQSLGIVTKLLGTLGLPPLSVIGSESAFLPLLVGTGIWKTVGFSAIIFLAAIAGLSPELYEAAMVDGANRFQRAIHVTLPGIVPVIVILLILQVGAIFSSNYLQILILIGGDASLYSVGDVVDTWVYRIGFFQGQMAIATAVGLLKGILGLGLILSTNWFVSRLTESGLW